MCGIAGLWGVETATASSLGFASLMASRLVHRGPDSAGSWMDENTGLALAHQRLAVVELSPAGYQPMMSASGRHVLSFNGEAYNHVALRNRLQTLGQAPRWRGNSDTETVLACISAWGIEAALREIVGMFALALWDREEQKLFLARDRFGEKPLYYGYVGRVFAFASELKAFKMLPGFRANIDRAALMQFLRYSYIPAPKSIYSDYFKLTPATWLELSADDVRCRKLPAPHEYWSALQSALNGIANQDVYDSDMQAVAALESCLTETVSGQMMADVPIGALLSGGVDSSTVVALMQACSRSQVRTFTVAFDDPRYDESANARQIARCIGTDHTEIYVSPQDALLLVPKLPTIYDEPFADVSQVPTYLVSKIAREYVTVTLSGDGGDELFGGYNRHLLAEEQWKTIERVPRRLRSILARVVAGVSPAVARGLFWCASPLMPASARCAATDDLNRKMGAMFGASDGLNLYLRLVSHWDPAGVVLGAHEPRTLVTSLKPPLPSLTEQMMFLDAATYLTGDILAKLDRASMSVSLEARVPLVDHRVFEFAWRLPLRYKVRHGEGKWILRQVLSKYVPSEFIDRPKRGFSVPIGAWLRGPLREWAEELLSAERIKNDAYFQEEPIRRLWAEHLSGRRNWQYHLWDVLMFQAWHERWMHS